MPDLEGRVTRLETRMDTFERVQGAHHTENARKIDENTRITLQTQKDVAVIQKLISQVIGMFKIASWFYRVVLPLVTAGLGWAGHKSGWLP